ncbi:MAG: type I 3-dehydroquinate dehydratase [Acidimicrobiales bacterium]
MSLRERWSSGLPAVAVSVVDEVADAELVDLVAGGLDVAEARIDRFTSVIPADVTANVARIAALVPVLATIRSRVEGGDWDGSEDERLALFERVAPAVAAVDIELSSSAILPAVIAIARRHDVAMVVSAHDYDRTPSLHELTTTVAQARDAGAEVVKIATLASTPEDLQVLAALTLAEADSGVIVVAMGPQGPPSRVFLPLLGSALTFASVGPPAVPGQLSFTDTVTALRQFSPAYAVSWSNRTAVSLANRTQGSPSSCSSG